MIPKGGIDLPYIREAFLRRFWYVVIPFFLISMAIPLYCILATRQYRAQTVILVEPQKVPGEYVSSTVTIDLSSRLRTIAQQIKSRTRLEKIIHDYDLYPDIRASATMTDAVETFRENIEVNVRGGRQAFEVSFQGKDPVKVRDVTNTIANLFIEDNLRLRETQAAGTTLFLDRELQRLQEILQQRDTAIREFKEKHRGFLPENMNQNNKMMSHLQEQLTSMNLTIQQTQDRKILLETQVNNLRRMDAQIGSQGGEEDYTYGDGTYEGQGADGRESPDLQELHSQLRKLQIRYSDKHPDIMRIQTMISKLEAEQEAQQSTDPGGGEDSAFDYSYGPSLFETQIQDLEAQVQLTRADLAKMRGQRAKIETEMDGYRHRIESGPKIEQMLLDLRRGYDEVDDNYRSLLDKKFKAKLAENLEMAQQGEQFTILDHAGLPDKPYKPQTRKILLIGVFLALAGGLGLAVTAEHLDRSFFSTKDVEDFLKTPVLASIPVILTDNDRKRVLMKRAVASAVVVSMVFILIGLLYYLWLLDPMAMSLSTS